MNGSSAVPCRSLSGGHSCRSAPAVAGVEASAALSQILQSGCPDTNPSTVETERPASFPSDKATQKDGCSCGSSPPQTLELRLQCRTALAVASLASPAALLPSSFSSRSPDVEPSSVGVAVPLLRRSHLTRHLRFLLADGSKYLTSCSGSRLYELL